MFTEEDFDDHNQPIHEEEDGVSTDILSNTQLTDDIPDKDTGADNTNNTSIVAVDGIASYLQKLNPDTAVVQYGEKFYHSNLCQAIHALGLKYSETDVRYVHYSNTLWGLAEKKIPVKSCLEYGLKIYNHGAWSLIFINVLSQFLRGNNKFFSLQYVIALRDITILFEESKSGDNVLQSKIVTPNKEIWQIPTVSCVSFSGVFQKKQIYHMNKTFEAISFITPYTDDEYMTIVQDKISSTTLAYQKISTFNIRNSYITLIVKHNEKFLISNKNIQISELFDNELPIIALISRIVDVKHGKNAETLKPKFTEYINVRLKPIILIIDYKNISQIKLDLLSLTRNDWSVIKNTNTVNKKM